MKRFFLIVVINAITKIDNTFSMKYALHINKTTFLTLKQKVCSKICRLIFLNIIENFVELWYYLSVKSSKVIERKANIISAKNKKVAATI